MAAYAGRTTRGMMFGIALCFLAALFFVEAKTTWADSSNHSPIDIAAAKAQAVDRSLTPPVFAPVKQSALEHPVPQMYAVVLALLAFLLAPVQRRANLLANGRRAYPAFFPFAHFDRPPPSR